MQDLEVILSESQLIVRCEVKHCLHLLYDLGCKHFLVHVDSGQSFYFIVENSWDRVNVKQVFLIHEHPVLVFLRREGIFVLIELDTVFELSVNNLESDCTRSYFAIRVQIDSF